jgi:carbonic anhydrase
MIEYLQVKEEHEYQAAVKLFKEYADWLNIDLSFQHFEDELKSIKKMYALPLGTIVLCKHDNDFIASVAIRPHKEKVAELKRMYVQPNYQGKGIGKKLLQLSINLAKEMGYDKILLDTLNTMLPAMQLYKSMGFYEVEAYYNNPEKTAVYFEKTI